MWRARLLEPTPFRERMRAAKDARRARLEERRTVRELGARAGTVGGVRDREADRRAAASFGLEGGELCGCHEPSCLTCAVNAGCGRPGCVDCRRLARRWEMIYGHAEATGAEATEGMIDMHAHNFCVQLGDLVSWSLGLGGTITEERLDRLRDMGTSTGLAASVLMGNTDYSAPTPEPHGYAINYVTRQAHEADPDYFLAFWHVKPDDLDDVTECDVMDRVFTSYPGEFSGVGELYVHGHGHEHWDLDKGFLNILRVAAIYNMPVSVHWEFGSNTMVEDATHGWVPGADPKDAWLHLRELLTRFPSATVDPWVEGDWASGTARAAPLKLIICHCGLGPPAPDGEDITEWSGLYQAWRMRMTDLLDNHPNVWFDLAGLQVGINGSTTKKNWRLYDADSMTLSELGEYLLDLIVRYPSRFLLGTDVDNGYPSDYDDGTGDIRWGVDTFADSISMYLTFLGFSTRTGHSVDAGTLEMLMYGNALDVLHDTL